MVVKVKIAVALRGGSAWSHSEDVGKLTAHSHEVLPCNVRNLHGWYNNIG